MFACFLTDIFLLTFFFGLNLKIGLKVDGDFQLKLKCWTLTDAILPFPVTRGKKKKKKALMKLMLLATILKGKIELLLKILSAHLQIKFFAIALVGLIINIARFWVDLKRGGSSQKV